MAFGDNFLENPDLFPARQTGETWGTDRVTIHFAGSRYAWTGLSATQAAAARERFGELCVAADESAAPKVEIRVFRAAPEDFADGNRQWEFDFELDYAKDSVSFAGFHFMGRLDWTPELQAAVWTSEDSRFVSHAIFENVLRLVAAYHLLEQGGVLLHSAAVGGASGAHLFFGPSGAGKSTISRLGLADGRVVLSDDMNAVRVTPAGVEVEKVPFAGDLGQTMKTAAGAYRALSLCRLEQGRPESLRPMRPAQAIAALIGCAPFVNRNPHRSERLFDALREISARLPVQVLKFAADGNVWSLLPK